MFSTVLMEVEIVVEAAKVDHGPGKIAFIFGRDEILLVMIDPNESTRRGKSTVQIDLAV